MNNHLLSKNVESKVLFLHLLKKVNSHFGFRLWIFIFSAITVLSSCNTNKLAKGKEKDVKPFVIYPSPPEQARVQYLTKLSTSADIGNSQSLFSKLILGPEKAKGIVKPYGIAIHKGKIYVCDQYGGGMEIIDLEKKDFIQFRPKGKGTLRAPINCFVDNKGFLYVADVGRLEIVVFDENGNFVKAFGEKEKFKPTDVFVYNDKIFVANPASNKVNVFSKDSLNKLLYSFPDIAPGERGFLGVPANLTVGNERVFVADFGHSMIERFTIDGKYIDSIGSAGDRPGQFSKLKGIAVDSEMNVFAVDAGYDHVQIFNKDGKLLLVIGGHYQEQGPGGLIIPAKVMIDYDNLKYFQSYVDPAYDLKYLIFVTSQYGPDLINVYGRVEPKVKPNK